MKQKNIKTEIINRMAEENINILILSKRTHINLLVLMFIIYMPFVKVRLTKYIKMCKALKIGMSDIFN